MLCEEKVKSVNQEDLLSLCECMKIYEQEYIEHDFFFYDIIDVTFVNLWGTDIDRSVRTVSSKKNRRDRATEQ